MKMKQIFEYHYLFLLVGLIFGMRMVYTNPPWHSNDEERHFFNAYSLSDGNLGPKIKDGQIGQYLPQNLVQNAMSYQGIKITEESKFQKSILDDLKATETDKKNKIFNKNPSSAINPFSYLPAAMGMGVAKMMDKSPVEISWFGRIGSLFAYLIIVSWAIRIIPRFKPLLTIIALSPMALYQATSVTYDTLSFAFMFLFFALLIQYYLQTIPISLKQIGLLILVAFLQRMCKEGYTILLLTVFILPMASFTNKKHYFMLLGGLCLASLLPSFLWGTYINSLHIPASASNQFQKDFLFDTPKNIRFHLSSPFHTIWLGIQNIGMQGNEWLNGVIARFGYSFTQIPSMAALLVWLMMFAASINEEPVRSKRFSIILFTVGGINLMAIIYGFLIIGSPVGSNVVFGMQGRYFIPILPFFLLGAFQIKLINIKPQYMKAAVFIMLIGILQYTLSYMDSWFYST